MKVGKIFILLLVSITACTPTSSVDLGSNQAQQQVEKPTIVEQDIEKMPEEVSPIKPTDTSTPVKPETVKNEDAEQEPSHAATTIDIPVGFASQAPFGVWDELHGEACEEASIAMVIKHFTDQPITPHIMDQEIYKLVDWQEANGYKIDATAQEVVEILKQVYNVDGTLILDPSIEDIKNELRAGNLIIVPAAGRLLGNPYFQNPGPIYHMLVVRGFSETEFITNDPGTKRGEGFRYRYSVLMNAIHDWNHALAQGGMTDEEIAQGRKVIISIAPF